MNKKITLLALGAISAMMLAVPALASAILPLHLEPTPSGNQTIDSNSEALLSTSENTLTVKCGAFTGTASFNAGGTTGSMALTFGPNCTTSGGGTCFNEGFASSIKTTQLPFELATVENNSGGTGNGVLVTPNTAANEHFASFKCEKVFGFLTVEKVIKGNGVIGTITEPSCNGTSNKATIKFEAEKHGLQKHRKLVNTPEPIYSLRSGTENAAQEAHGTLTLSTNSKLICT